MYGRRSDFPKTRRLKMTDFELRKLGFVSREHYEEAINAVVFAGTGAYTTGGSTGLSFSTNERLALTQKLKATTNLADWSSYECSATEGHFPSSFDLTDKIHSHIFNQGTRGTCLAQTVAALASYYFGKKEILSTEYIFACLKSYEHDLFASAYNEFFEKNPTPIPLETSVSVEKMDCSEHFQNNTALTEQDFVTLWKHFRHYDIPRSGIIGSEDEYWKIFSQEIKKIKDPYNDDGSLYSLAYNVFSEKGFASWDAWPYSFSNIPGNSGHLPIPQEAIADAEKRKIKDQLYLFSTGGNVDEIKKFITGNNGKQRPMPVAIGVYCLNSWSCSPFTRKTGWFNMPVCDEIKLLVFSVENKLEEKFISFFERILPSLSSAFQEQIKKLLEANNISLEKVPPYNLASLLFHSEDGKNIWKQLEPVMDDFRENYIHIPEIWEDINGGHAMLVVGYKDEPMIPGGGYFIVRNSWGENWAALGEYPGHAKIPYAYIDLFCGSAMSIIQPIRNTFKNDTTECEASSLDEKINFEHPNSVMKTYFHVFVAYRRNGALREAKHLTDRLLRDGYSVSLDIENLPPGNFRQALATRVEDCTDFILMLSPGVFDKCLNGKSNREEDILFDEIATAISLGKNIIPVALDGYIPPRKKDMPPEIAQIIDLNWVRLRYESYNDDYQKLKWMLVSDRSNIDCRSIEPFKTYRLIQRQQQLKCTQSGVMAETHYQTADILSLFSKSFGVKGVKILLAYLLRKYGSNSSAASINRRILSNIQNCIALGKDTSLTLTSGETKIRLNFYGKNKTATVTCFKNVVGEYCNSFLSQAKHGVYYYLTKLNSAFADSAKDILLESPAAEGSNINTTTDIIVQKKNTEDDNVPEKKENERPDTKWDLCIKNDFIQTIESNLTYHERQFCFPGINLPFPYRYFPWQISVKETIVYDDNLTETWINILKQKGNIAENDLFLIKNTSSIRKYELKNAGVSFLIIAAYLTSWKNGKKISVPPEYIECVQYVKDEALNYAQNYKNSRISAFGIIVGSSDLITNDIMENYQGGSCEFVIYCNKTQQNNWIFNFPTGAQGDIWWHFAIHLLPIMPCDLVEDLRQTLEKMWQSDAKRWTVENLCTEWGKPKELFVIVFRELCKRQEFIIKNGELTKNKKSLVLDVSQIENPTGIFGFIFNLIHAYIDELLAVALTTLAYYIWIGTNSSNRYKVATVLGLALAGFLGKICKEMHKRKTWRK